MGDEYIEAEEAAKELGMSRATLWRLMKERDVERFRRPGSRKALIRKRDLEALRQPVPLRRRMDETQGKAAA